MKNQLTKKGFFHPEFKLCSKNSKEYKSVMMGLELKLEKLPCKLSLFKLSLLFQNEKGAADKLAGPFSLKTQFQSVLDSHEKLLRGEFPENSFFPNRFSQFLSKML